MTKYLNLRAISALGLIFVFLFHVLGPIPTVQASVPAAFVLPEPGVTVSLSGKFNPPILKGLKVHPDNPFKFDFILDPGDFSPLYYTEGVRGSSLKDESTKLIKYFLASLTIPQQDLWVNLSPYEKNRIIPQVFGQTEMGRDLLAEDYMLKQITASLMYPEGETGRRFWKKVYEQAAKKFGTTNIPVNTFNKVWILPDKAVVYENLKANAVYVVESTLKVMLEEDYLSLSKHADVGGLSSGIPKSYAKADDPRVRLTWGKKRGSPLFSSFGHPNISELSSQIIREIIIPELTKEINEGTNFAQLRQVYNSLILANWYKKKIKDSILAAVYENKNKVTGILSSLNPSIGDPAQIYQRYLQAFKKGAYNYVKQEQDLISQQSIPRKYFSGGEVFTEGALTQAMSSTPEMPSMGNAAMSTLGVEIMPVADRSQSNEAQGFKPYPSIKGFFGHYHDWRAAHPDAVVVSIVRHGESASNLFEYTQSQDTYSPLTIQGDRQRRVMTKLFTDLGIKFDAFYSSNLERAYETVRLLARRQNKKVNLEPSLREIMLTAQGGVSVNSPGNELRQNRRLFIENPLAFKAAGDISIRDSIEGLRGFIRRLQDQRGKNVILASHGLTINLLVMTMLGIPYSEMRDHMQWLKSENLGITSLAYDPHEGRWHLLVKSDNTYLPRDLQHFTEGSKLPDYLLYYARGLNRKIINPLGMAPQGINDWYPKNLMIKGDFAMQVDIDERNFKYDENAWKGQGPYKLSQNYIDRFLPLVNPSRKPNDWHPQGNTSLVAFIPKEVLTQSPGYRKIKEAIEASTFSHKVSFSDEGKIHFTFRGNYSAHDLDEIRKQLNGAQRFRVRVKGIFINNFIQGRVFLKVYPEFDKNLGKNGAEKIIERLKGAQFFGTHLAGFLQLTDDLNEEETKEFLKIIEDFKDEDIAQFQIHDLVLGAHKNDLLGDWSEIGRVNLLSPNTAMKTQDVWSGDFIYGETMRAIDKVGQIRNGEYEGQIKPLRDLVQGLTERQKLYLKMDAKNIIQLADLLESISEVGHEEEYIPETLNRLLSAIKDVLGLGNDLVQQDIINENFLGEFNPKTTDSKDGVNMSKWINQVGVSLFNDALKAFSLQDEARIITMRGLISDYQRNIFPLRDKTAQFWQVVKRRCDLSAMPLLLEESMKFRKSLRRQIVQDTGMPESNILFFSKNDVLMKYVMFLDREKFLGGHTALMDDQGNHDEFMSINWDLRDDQILLVAAHETGHALEDPDFNKKSKQDEFNRVISEGSQRRREYERLIEWRKKNTYVARQIRQIGSGANIDLINHLNKELGYEEEQAFVLRLSAFAGKGDGEIGWSALKEFMATGNEDRLAALVGRTRYDVIKEFMNKTEDQFNFFSTDFVKREVQSLRIQIDLANKLWLPDDFDRNPAFPQGHALDLRKNEQRRITALVSIISSARKNVGLEDAQYLITHGQLPETKDDISGISDFITEQIKLWMAYGITDLQLRDRLMDIALKQRIDAAMRSDVSILDGSFRGELEKILGRYPSDLREILLNDVIVLSSKRVQAYKGDVLYTPESYHGVDTKTRMDFLTQVAGLLEKYSDGIWTYMTRYSSTITGIRLLGRDSMDPHIQQGYLQAYLDYLGACAQEIKIKKSASPSADIFMTRIFHGENLTDAQKIELLGYIYLWSNLPLGSGRTGVEWSFALGATMDPWKWVALQGIAQGLVNSSRRAISFEEYRKGSQPHYFKIHISPNNVGGSDDFNRGYWQAYMDGFDKILNRILDEVVIPAKEVNRYSLRLLSSTGKSKKEIITCLKHMETVLSLDATLPHAGFEEFSIVTDVKDRVRGRDFLLNTRLAMAFNILLREDEPELFQEGFYIQAPRSFQGRIRIGFNPSVAKTSIGQDQLTKANQKIQAYLRKLIRQLQSPADAAMKTGKLTRMTTKLGRLRQSNIFIPIMLQQLYKGAKQNIWDIGPGLTGELGYATTKELALRVHPADVIAIDNQNPEYQIITPQGEALLDAQGIILSLESFGRFFTGDQIPPGYKEHFDQIFKEMKDRVGSKNPYFQKGTNKIVFRPMEQHEEGNIKYFHGDLFDLQAVEGLDQYKPDIVRIANVIQPYYGWASIEDALKGLNPLMGENGIVLIGTQEQYVEQYFVYQKRGNGFKLVKFAADDLEGLSPADLFDDSGIEKRGEELTQAGIPNTKIGKTLFINMEELEASTSPAAMDMKEAFEEEFFSKGVPKHVYGNSAMRVAHDPGGIDFTSAKIGGQGGIQFSIDSAQLAQLEKTSGFKIRGMTIQPLKSLSAFFSLSPKSI